MVDPLTKRTEVDSAIQNSGSLEELALPAGEVTATTSFDPGMFDRVGSFVQQRNARQLLEHLDRSGDLSILDLGCANGEFALEQLLPRCGSTGTLTGIDLSQDMIADANTRITPELGARVKFLRGDLAQLEDLGLQRNHYQVAFSNFVLHWLGSDQADQFLSGLRTLVSADASLLFCLPIQGTYSELVESACEVVRTGSFNSLFNEQSQRRFKFPDPQEFVQLVESHGARIVEAFQREVWRPLTGREALAEWFFYTMSPFTFGFDALQGDERKQLGVQIAENYQQRMSGVTGYPGTADVPFVRDLTLVVAARMNPISGN